MSTRIRMTLVMNFLTLMFSTALFYSDQTTMSLKSFKISENITYDCFNIYKQPGLDHPLLKNHKIQMKPSVLGYELKNQTGNNKTFNRKKVLCPKGTVPILRNMKELITSSKTFAEKYFHPLSSDSPGTHIAGVRSLNGPFHGVESLFDGYALDIGKDQASYSQIYIGSGANNEVNFISAGGMINPSVFGDGRVWTYGFWKGKDGKGCYNTACPGFVQVSHEIPLSTPNVFTPGVPHSLHISIHQDKQTGNWWITQLMKNAPSVDIGYWPKELFNLLDNGAIMAGVGGVVQASRSGLSPPMGNGNFPSKNRSSSAIFANIEVLNSNYEKSKISSFTVEKLLDSANCYGVRFQTKSKFFHVPELGYFFNYGGPGGNSCGI